jgi:hypothetical protein
MLRRYSTLANFKDKLRNGPSFEEFVANGMSLDERLELGPNVQPLTKKKYNFDSLDMRSFLLG